MLTEVRSNKPRNSTSWLKRRLGFDVGGQGRAKFPYDRFATISCYQDCREALLDETFVLESEFGAQTIEPIYELVWTINQLPRWITSHTVVGSYDLGKFPEFGNAQHNVGSAITILPKDPTSRRSHEELVIAVDDFVGILATSERLDRYRTKGWLACVSTEAIEYFPEAAQPFLGWGVEFRFAGFAGTRRRAADRWSHIASFAAATLAD